MLYYSQRFSKLTYGSNFPSLALHIWQGIPPQYHASVKSHPTILSPHTFRYIPSFSYVLSIPPNPAPFHISQIVLFHPTPYYSTANFWINFRNQWSWRALRVFLYLDKDIFKLLSPISLISLISKYISLTKNFIKN